MTDAAPKRISREDAQSEIDGRLVAEILRDFGINFHGVYPDHVLARGVGPEQSMIGLAIKRGHIILASEHAALIREAEARGMERAAKILDKRIESIVADHGSHEWDTNVTNLPEWVETATEELEAQAASIRAAKATP